MIPDTLNTCRRILSSLWRESVLNALSLTGRSQVGPWRRAWLIALWWMLVGVGLAICLPLWVLMWPVRRWGSLAGLDRLKGRHG